MFALNSMFSFVIQMLSHRLPKLVNLRIVRVFSTLDALFEHTAWPFPK